MEKNHLSIWDALIPVIKNTTKSKAKKTEMLIYFQLIFLKTN